MAFYEFIWTDDLIEHLAEHGIAPEDFQDVVQHPEELDVSHSSGRPIAWGHTADGRYIIAVFEWLDKMTILPVTAYEVPEPGE